MGTIQGICLLAAAVLNLAQAPLVACSVNTLNADFRPMLGISLVAAAPLPVLWSWVARAHSRKTVPKWQGTLQENSSMKISHTGCARTGAQQISHQASIERMWTVSVGS